MDAHKKHSEEESSIAPSAVKTWENAQHSRMDAHKKHSEEESIFAPSAVKTWENAKHSRMDAHKKHSEEQSIFAPSAVKTWENAQHSRMDAHKKHSEEQSSIAPVQQRPGRMRSILAWMRTKNIAKSKASSHPNACLSDSVPFHFKHPPRRAKHRAAGWVRSFLRRKTFCEGRKTAARIGVTNKFFSPPDSKQGGGRKRSTKIKFKFVRIEKIIKRGFQKRK